MSNIEKFKKFWKELQKRNVFRFMTFYTLTSWLIIQFAVATFPFLQFPDWTVRMIIIITIAGFPVALVVSWVYELTKDGLKKTNTVSNQKSLTKRTGKKLNRLIIGVLILVISFLLIDKFWLSTRPVKTLTENAAIAIFPFSVQGSESIQYLKEGMVDLISTKLDGMPGMNATDPNILLSSVGKVETYSRDPKSAGELAEDLGANRFVLGSITELGDKLQVKLSKYDIDGKPIGKTIVETGEAQILYSNIDNIIRRLVSDELEETGKDFNSEAVMTTQKLESIIPYLKGEQLRRNGKYQKAAEAYQESLAYDSLFVIAYVRLYEAMAWVPQVYDYVVEQKPVYEKIRGNIGLLSGKNREITEAYLKFWDAHPDAEDNYRRLIKKYGESQTLLSGLAETLFHFHYINGRGYESKEYFEKLVKYDPYNEEVKTHLMDIALFQQDTSSLNNYVSSLSKDSDNYGMYALQNLVFKENIDESELQVILESLESNDQTMGARSGTIRLAYYEMLEKLQHRSKVIKKQMPRFENAKKMAGGQHQEFFDKFLENYEEEPFKFDALVLRTAYNGFPLLGNRVELLIDHYENVPLETKRDTSLVYHILGLLHHLNADEESFNDAEDIIKMNFNDEAEGPIAQLSYYQLRGITQKNEGNFDVALTYFDSAANVIPATNSWGPILGMAFNRIIHEAEIYVQMEKPDKALALYETIYITGDNYDHSVLYLWGLSMYRIGQIKQVQGKTEEAIGYYSMFTDLYKNCDEIYQPWVDDSKIQLTRLIESPESIIQADDQSL